MDLFLTFFGGNPVPPQVDNSAESSRNPRDNGTPPPHPPLPAGNSLYQLPRRQRGLRHCIIAFALMVV